MPQGKGPLRIAIEDFIDTFGFGKKSHGWLTNVFETWEQEAIDEYEKSVTALGIKESLPDFLQPASLRARITHSIGLIAILLPILIGLAQTVVQVVILPFIRPMGYLTEALAHTKHLDAPELYQAIRRDPSLHDKLRNHIPGTGYDDETLKAIQKLLDQYLTPFEYQALVLRGSMSQEQVDNILVSLGYTPDAITGLHELSRAIPPITDLIRMQVREAFRDDVAARYGYDEGDISQVTAWAAKQGLDAEWVKRYWRSHWELPSVNQVFEMFHRLRPGTTDTPVTLDEVNQFLGLADYAPGWRERLTQISYAPFTRVDVRRMYKTHVLDEAQVKEAYLDLGYDDAKAQALTQFTIAYEAEEETAVVRTSVTAAYSNGMIDRPTAEGMLSQGGYDGTTIAFYLDAIDFNHSLEVKKIKLDDIHKRFVNGVIDETSLTNEIGLLALPAERTQALMELWTTERNAQTNYLTITQMETLLEDGIVSADDYTRIAKLRGYTDESIDWSLQRIQQEANIKAQNAAEKAQADNERLLKSTAASQYQKDKSSLDLLIAQAKAEITDIDVALHTASDPADIDSLKARKDELKLFIAERNIDKAQLRFDLTSRNTSTGG